MSYETGSMNDLRLYKEKSLSHSSLSQLPQELSSVCLQQGKGMQRTQGSLCLLDACILQKDVLQRLENCLCLES